MKCSFSGPQIKCGPTPVCKLFFFQKLQIFRYRPSLLVQAPHYRHFFSEKTQPLPVECPNSYNNVFYSTDPSPIGNKISYTGRDFFKKTLENVLGRNYVSKKYTFLAMKTFRSTDKINSVLKSGAPASAPPPTCNQYS